MSVAPKDFTVEGIARDSSLSLGQYGATYIATTGTNINGKWGCITALDDSVFSTLTVSNWSGASTSNLALRAGITIFGDFSLINLTSGRVVAYNAAF